MLPSSNTTQIFLISTSTCGSSATSSNFISQSTIVIHQVNHIRKLQPNTRTSIRMRKLTPTRRSHRLCSSWTSSNLQGKTITSARHRLCWLWRRKTWLSKTLPLLRCSIRLEIQQIVSLRSRGLTIRLYQST